MSVITTDRPDFLAIAVRASWDAHAAALATGDDLAIETAYLATLRADLALERDCAGTASTDGSRRAYAASIIALEAEIEDAEKRIAKLTTKGI